ncbi:MAG: hypothetical protein WKF47_09240 [Geodermatophilaceae bacterium]
MTLLEPTRPASRPRAAGRGAPRRRGGVVLLPPWTRAPWLSFGQPAVIFAVLGAAAILACASSSAALFLSSASSESLRVQLAAECGGAAYPQLEETSVGTGSTVGDGAVRNTMTDQGLADPYRVQTTSGSVSLNSAGQSTLGRIFFRDGATDNVDILSGTADGTGVVVPDFTAQRLDVGVGDTVNAAGYAVPVVGVYTDLYREQLPREFLVLLRGAVPQQGIAGPPATGADPRDRPGGHGRGLRRARRGLPDGDLPIVDIPDRPRGDDADPGEGDQRAA